MICQDNHAYNVALGSGDNPLPIQGQDGGKPGKTLPFRAHIMFNGSVPKPKCIPSTVEASEVVGCYNDTGHQCGYEMLQSLPKTNSHRNAATECAGAGYSYGGAEDGLGAEVWCGHGPPNCPKIADSNCGSGCPGNSSEKCGGSWALTALGIRCTHLPPPTTTTVAVRWQPWQGSNARGGGPISTIPKEFFTSVLPPAEQQRESLQRGVSVGWGPVSSHGRSHPKPSRLAAPSQRLSLADVFPR